MKIRDSFATLNGDDTEYEMTSGGLEIVGDDGRTMFCISLKGNVLSIDGGMVCRQDEKLLDDRFILRPKAANCIDLIKTELDS